MTEYEDLAFEPAMTTEELCKYIKEKYPDNEYLSVDDEVKTCETIIIDNKEGDDIQFDIPAGIVALNGTIIAWNVKPEKIKIIIDNLYGE